MKRLVPLLALAACAHAPAPPVPPPCPYEDARDGTQSAALLCREPVANKVKVKHILIGWRDLKGPHPPDPRALERSREDAQGLARHLLDRLAHGAPIEPLMRDYSEDPGSAVSGTYYDVAPDAPLVPPFKALSLRLEPGESGIVESPFGLHVVQRVE